MVVDRVSKGSVGARMWLTAGWLMGSALAACGDDGSAGPAGAGSGSGAPVAGTLAEGAACSDNDRCAPAAEPCQSAVCVSGRCRITTDVTGTAVADDQPGDCKQLRCGPGGMLETHADPQDVPPEDGDPCTLGRCAGASPEQGPAPVGTPCGDGLPCNAQGACSACIGDGGRCTTETPCCDGVCYEGTCTACPEGRGDCDGLASNGCEAELHMRWNCGVCGNDCTALPNVAEAHCDRSYDCHIVRCEGRSADVDGDYKNGCEGEPQVGPQGAYAPCTASTQRTDCGVGELCMGGTILSGGYFSGPSRCPSSQEYCFCGFPCAQASDCPIPTTGNASPECGLTCFLPCASGIECPEGMVCSAPDLAELEGACVWL